MKNISESSRDVLRNIYYGIVHCRSYRQWLFLHIFETWSSQAYMMSILLKYLISKMKHAMSMICLIIYRCNYLWMLFDQHCVNLDIWVHFFVNENEQTIEIYFTIYLYICLYRLVFTLILPQNIREVNENVRIFCLHNWDQNNCVCLLLICELSINYTNN